MKYLYSLVAICCFLFSISSCDIINPSEPTPTYIRVDTFSFASNNLLGTRSHKITSVYAYLNNQSIGVYDLPITFPVIMDKKSRLQLTAGIDYNGFGGIPAQYPFYASFIDSISPTPGQVINTAPVTQYHSSAKMIYNADFENSNPFQAVNPGDTPIIRVTYPDQVFEGGGSGLLYLTATMDSSIVTNSDAFDISSQTDVYLEINYKSTIPFTVGLVTIPFGVTRIQYLAGFNPRSSWNKVYIDLKTFASTYRGGNFNLLIRAVKESSQRGKDGYVLIDNVKIVSF
jgi:hypothetical protein